MLFERKIDLNLKVDNIIMQDEKFMEISSPCVSQK